MKKEEKKHELVVYRKSNTLINAKGKSTPLGLKLFAVGILKAHPNPDGTITAHITGQELRRLFNRTSGSFYSEIRELIKPSDETKPSILDWRIYIEDEEKEKLVGINVVTNASFENGELSLTFNRDLKNHIYGLKGDYGSLNIATTLALKSGYAIRFYEIFKAYVDKQTAVTKNTTGPYELTYTLNELREVLGLVKIVRTKDGPVRQELLKDYTNFKNRVLIRACDEINSISSIHAEFEPIRAGRGGKITGIRFFLTRQNTEPKPEDNTSITDDKLNILNDASILLKDTSLNLLDIKSICDAAGYDMEKIKLAYQLSKKAKNIDSLTGWMIAAIRDGYQDTPKRKKKDSFNSFEQNTYDFDELERKLLKT